MALIEEAKFPNDFRFRIGQQGESDFPPLRETRQLLHGIIANGGNPIAQPGEFSVPFVPGDRLGLTVNSPIEGTGK
ncbi:MAG: hypothetical protein OEU46_11195 [Alphaproteobacteria bacterium]|nr:hypothetical protein [Alphaproteobacteria bacterium]